MEDKITESKTDDGQEYIITGLNPTDHNVITATIVKGKNQQPSNKNSKTTTEKRQMLIHASM